MQIEQLMSALKINEAEARQLIADDLAIDRGEKLFELTDEQKKVEKKMRSTGTRIVKDAYGKSHKTTKKVNNDKIYLIDTLCETLADCTPEVINPEREIIFHYNGTKYKITLSAPRSQPIG